MTEEEGRKEGRRRAEEGEGGGEEGGVLFWFGVGRRKEGRRKWVLKWEEGKAKEEEEAKQRREGVNLDFEGCC